MQRISAAIGVGPSDLAPWVVSVDPWLAHALVDEERNWLTPNRTTYGDRLAELQAVDAEVAEASGDPELARIADLLSLDVGHWSDRRAQDPYPAALALVLEGTDLEADVALARLCPSEMEHDHATHEALRQRAMAATDAKLRLALTAYGLRAASNTGLPEDAREWSAMLEPALSVCEQWGAYTDLADVALPTFEDLGPTFAPAAAEAVADTLVARWPSAEVMVDCELAPCLLRFPSVTEREARWMAIDTSLALAGSAWKGVPVGVRYDYERGPAMVLFGATAAASGLDPDVLSRWTDWRAWREHVFPSDCLLEGDRALLRATASRLEWRPARTWMEDMERAAAECFALFPLERSGRVDARWDGDHWALTSKHPFATCLEEATVLGPPSPEAFDLVLRVDE